jgi:diacylglycerol kinase family enzyme
MRRAGHRAHYQSSKDENWERVLKEPADLVAIAGGDGIVGRVAKSMIEQETPLAILPLGTANNVFKTLYPSADIEDLVFGWARARPRSCDLGIARGPWGEASFIESFGIGLLARMILNGDPRGNATTHDPVEQPEAFFQQMTELSRAYPVHRLKVALDGQDLSGEYLMLEAMNMKFAGSNLYLASNAQQDDGLLDIVLAGAEQRDLFISFLQGRVDDPAKPARFPIHQGRSLQVEFNSRDVHIDDQVWPDRSSSFPHSATAELSVQAKAVQFLVPYAG